MGFITAIDYAKGRFEVNGTLNTPGTGTVVEINDPVGRYGLAHSPDPRFTADTDNPTVTQQRLSHGYPGSHPLASTRPPLFNRPFNPAPGVTIPFPHDPFLQVGAPLNVLHNAPSVGTSLTRRHHPRSVEASAVYGRRLRSATPGNPDKTRSQCTGEPDLILPRLAGPNNRSMRQQFYISANSRPKLQKLRS